MDKFKKCLSLILMALCCAYTIDGFSQDTKESRQMIIIKKTIDKNGEETVEKQVFSGDDISEAEMDKLINDNEASDVDVWVSNDVTQPNLEDHEIRIFTADDELLEDFLSEHKLSTDQIETIDITVESTIENGVEKEVKTMKIIDKNGKTYQTGIKEGGKTVRTKGPVMQFDYVPSRPKLGVMVENNDRGAKIVEVITDSPAAEAGLQVNDIIYGIGETPITSSADLVASLANAKDKVYVAYHRGTEVAGTWVTLSPFEFKSDSKEKILKN